MEKQREATGYRSYGSRWGVWAAVVVLNSAINASWVSYSPVATQAAAYYETDASGVDNFVAIVMLVGMPLGLITTWLTQRLGLRKTALASAVLAFAGNLMRCITTFPGLGDSYDKQTQYYLALTANFIIAVGNPLCFSLTNLVVRHWFPPEQSVPAAGGISISVIFGMGLGQCVTPLFVSVPNDIQVNNIVWLVPTAIALVMVLAFIRSDKPPTPPSKSAEEGGDGTPYLLKMKLLLTNKQYLVLLITLGGSIGYCNAIVTQMQQMLCSRNYEDWVTAAASAALIFGLIFGGVAQTLIAHRIGRIVDVAKVSFDIGVIFLITWLLCAREYDLEVVLIIAAGLGGFFAGGIMPLGMELSQEVTYPLDPAAPAVLIHFVGLTTALVFVLSAGFMETSLPNNSPETCSAVGTDSEGNAFVEPKDHTNFAISMMCYAGAVALFFTTLFRPTLKRTEANKAGQMMNGGESQRVTKSAVVEITKITHTT